VIRDTLERCPVHAAGKLDAILADDAAARGCAAELINNGKVTMAR